jgi:hypothetical protein
VPTRELRLAVAPDLHEVPRTRRPRSRATQEQRCPGLCSDNVSGSEVVAFEKQGDVKVFRESICDAIAQVETGGCVDAFAVAHVGSLGRMSLIGVKRHDLGLDGIKDLGKVA